MRPARYLLLLAWANGWGCAPATVEPMATADAAVSARDAGGCAASQVRCAAPFPCAGQCVADCRVAGQECAATMPRCDERTGLCQLERTDGGSDGPRPVIDGGRCDDAGECANPAMLCCQRAPCVGQCLPDCRSMNNQCPLATLFCNSTTGFCDPLDAGQTDAQRPPPPDGGTCTDAGGCGSTGFVCCQRPPCTGSCIVDCRTMGNQCPVSALVCSPLSGLCDFPDGGS